ncbi:MAG: helix-turn-helix transcriptional regulator [Deltaproteobacteria bacterium]|nr:helix-turn-helix transcriptional regulator [Deltaproteobacteria bacterium]MBI2974486.1 helix-turn-helix transcriptional regulator [Deltaproteobacteria bacterium]
MKKETKRVTLRDAIKKELKNSEFKFRFEHEKAIGQIARIVRSARQRAGLTQAGLARRAGTSQVVIARLESGTDHRIPSLDLLQRIAQALHFQLMISFDMAA